MCVSTLELLWSMMYDGKCMNKRIRAFLDVILVPHVMW